MVQFARVCERTVCSKEQVIMRARFPTEAVAATTGGELATIRPLPP